MARHRLTDEEWAIIYDVSPQPPRMGRPTVNRRNVFDGMLWILQTGAPWRDMPEEFGKWQTVWRLFNDWNKDGTIIRAARCAAGARKKAA